MGALSQLSFLPENSLFSSKEEQSEVILCNPGMDLHHHHPLYLFTICWWLCREPGNGPKAQRQGIPGAAPRK